MSPTRVAKPPTSNRSVFRDIVSNKFLWSYMFAALIVFALILYIVWNCFHDVNSWARTPGWIANPFTHSVFFIVALLGAAVSTGYAVRYLDTRWSVMTQALFLVVALLIIIIAVAVFRSHNFLLAFWLAILALVLLLNHTYAVSFVMPGITILNLPIIAYMALVVYYTWYMADETRDISTVTTC